MTLADQSGVREADASGDTVAERAGPYVSRMLIQHLATDPDKRTWSSEGSAAFVDISGFTKLSESLAKKAGSVPSRSLTRLAACSRRCSRSRMRAAVAC
jgi:hypothetical protein